MNLRCDKFDKEGILQPKAGATQIAIRVQLFFACETAHQPAGRSLFLAVGFLISTFPARGPYIREFCADPVFDLAFHPGDGVSSQRNGFGKFSFGHPSVDRRAPETDTMLDLLEADEAGFGKRVLFAFSHVRCLPLHREVRRGVQARQYDPKEVLRPGGQCPWPSVAGHPPTGCQAPARERRAART